MLFWRHLALLVVGVACQVLALLFPRIAVPLVGAGTMLLAVVDLRSVMGGPSPGPFPVRTSGGPGTRILLLLFAGLCLSQSSCATPQAAQAGRAELACATSITPDVFAAVVTALGTGGVTNPMAWVAPMEALASTDGPMLIKCAVAALLTPPPAATPEMGATAVPRLNALTAQRAVMWLATR